MPETRYTPREDLTEAQAMAKGLERYLQQDALYGSVGGGGFFGAGQMPALTVGALVMRLRRLDALRQADALLPNQAAELDLIVQQVEAVRREWNAHYHLKVQRETHSRLDAMQTFFEECAANPRLCARVYMPEAMRRTVVEELFIHMQQHAIPDALLSDDPDALSAAKKANRVDQRLRRFVQGSDFVWDEPLRPAYEPLRFWWLYHHPPVVEK